MARTQRHQIDQTWKEIIELAEVPNAPGLFVLGSFARRVTVYSQQLRALNFVDALAGMGYLRKKARVAVVGAGFAGLTTSAALAKLGVSVTLFDKHSVLARLQSTSKTRYLHPHIYSWPERLLEETDAGLPFLNWKAGNADEVAAKIALSWENLAAKHEITRRLEVEVTGVERVDADWVLDYEHEDGAELRKFDMVVLALGFGVEKTDKGQQSHSYWADLPLKDEAEQSKQWLVSGAGDGALTDVMQLCVRYHDQAATLKEVVKALHSTVKKGTLDKLKEKVRQGKGGKELFEGIDARKIAATLKLRGEPVYLNATERRIFGTENAAPLSSTLNRLVVWILLETGKVELKEGRIAADRIEDEDGTYQVTLCGEREDRIPCQAVLLRHGPEAVLPDAPWLSGWSRPLRRLKRGWKSLYRSGNSDPTLREVPVLSDFDPKRLVPAAVDLAGILIYSKDPSAPAGSTDTDSLETTFRHLLTRNKVKESLAELQDTPVQQPTEGIAIVADEVLRDPRSFGMVVQALCHAPLAIFDGTRITPALALLLGIRAATRRGVTIVFHEGKLDVKAWQLLPFNLREIRTVAVTDRHSNEGFRVPLIHAIEQGFHRYAMGPDRYADLPGFASLRNLGAKAEEVSPRPGKTEVLVLCPFDQSFDDHWVNIRNALHEHYYRGDDGDHPAVRVVDMVSPEMLSKRLFETIRRDEECVADLTTNRPNVFFELGIRVAVHVRGARIIQSSESGKDAEGELVGAMLGMNPYDKTEASILEALRMTDPIWPGGLVSASYVHSLAERCVRPAQEAGGIPVLDVLWDIIASVGGADRQKQVTPPVLYQGNPRIRRNVSTFVFDGLLAYCLLAEKLPSGTSPSSRKKSALIELRNTLRDLPISESERKAREAILAQLADDDGADDTKADSVSDLLSTAEMTRASVIEIRNQWKDSPDVSRRDEEFENAATSMRQVIEALEERLSHAEKKSIGERELSARLADCHGVLGGLHRDRNDLREAVSAYQTGRKHEKRAKALGGLSNSYCLVQELVNRVLLHAAEAGNPVRLLESALRRARAELEKQLQDDRRGDIWLQADIALITQILDPLHAIEQWEAFEDLLPPGKAYQSAATVAGTLFDALKGHLTDEEKDAWKESLAILR